MNAVLWGKCKKFIRKPGGFIITSLICIVFAYLVGISSFTKVEVPIFTDQSTKANNILKDLNKSESYSFVSYTEEEVKEQLAKGEADVGVSINADTYTIFRIAETANVLMVQNFLQTYYGYMLKEDALLNNAADKEEAKRVLISNKETPIIPVSNEQTLSEKEATYNQSLQSLFGFTLFFCIYTVSFTVIEILRDKQNGIWDRFILSSTSKAQIYLGHLLFSFFIGYAQIIMIFLLFKYGLNIDFNGNFYLVYVLIIPYLFSIVALTILLTGLVKTPSQFNAIIPLVSVSFAMLGGAYWPIEIVTSKVMLLLSKFIPITYGMELLKKGIIESASWMDIMVPAGILCLMGTIMLGIGIQLIEKRHV
ncbi:ABC transporter permease [Niallia alba]|uniref:ABC transporter permease n=1 Tax=Niallia circulans TaxID=1397 RepID=A0A941GI59_NIACI|nr:MULTISPECIES: ABC transporter permease [Niallia]EOR24888.1 ABC transporter [Niallia nealsonii AAU1]MCB5236673.1 ABC transporter permease [Niallia circulans]MED3792058.1 ABC transporter permease [Niallia alba]